MFEEYTPEPIYGSSSSEIKTSMSEQYKTGVVLFFAVTLLSVVFVSLCSVRQYFKKCCATSQPCWRPIFSRESQETRNPEQYFEDRILAEDLQRRINEEERQRERLSKRKERSMWYEYYMKPWTMVVEKSDIFHANREEDARKAMVQIDTKRTSKDGVESLLDLDIEQDRDDADRRRSSQCHVCDEDDENAPSYLKLPASGRCVDGTCALCIEEYKVGDKVIWSDLECTHAFHKECLMQWLSKGKKRCPVCRHWFVPGSKIADQKLSHGKTWQHALLEMEEIEKEEIEKQTTKEETETESVKDLEQGTVEIDNTLPSSQYLTTMITSESIHTKLGHDNWECNISCNEAGDSENFSVLEVNNIES